MDKTQKITIIKRIIFLLFLVIMIGIVIFIIKKYEVEGEKSLPYGIEKILIISTVEGKVNEDEANIWNINLSQVNDVYIYMNSQEKSEVTIKDITLDNFQIINKPQKGELKLLRPTGELNNLYTYSEQDYLNSSLTYTGAKIDDLKNLEISNIGGVMAFRMGLHNLGTYTSNEDTEISYNGSLLPKIGISNEEIKFGLSFDMTIQTNDNVSFKGNIKIDLPAGDIVSEGTSNIEITDFSNIIFKRVQKK